MSRVHLTGKPLAGERPEFIRRFLEALAAAGATKANVESAYRSPEYNRQVGGASSSNHTRGLAIDATVYLPGRGWVPAGDVSTLKQYGLRSGDQPGFFHGQPDPNHVDAGYMAQGVAPAAKSGPGPQSEWPASAMLAFQLARQRGLSPFQATDFAGAQYGESGFNPSAVNKSSGAAGLYQLLSPGYVNRANQLGGVLNPRANIQAILPDYAAYYRSHPGARPGEAAAAVEKSGEGAAYYAAGNRRLGGAPPATAPQGAPPAAAAHPGADTRAFTNTLLAATRSSGGLTPAALLTALRASTAHMRA